MGVTDAIKIAKNVWTIDEEPPDDIVTLHRRTRDPHRVRVALQRPGR
jgi:hypothetical protein